MGEWKYNKWIKWSIYYHPLILKGQCGPLDLRFPKISFWRDRKRQKWAKSFIVEFPWRRRGAKGESKGRARVWEFVCRDLHQQVEEETKAAHIPRIHASQERSVNPAGGTEVRLYQAELQAVLSICRLCFVCKSARCVGVCVEGVFPLDLTIVSILGSSSKVTPAAALKLSVRAVQLVQQAVLSNYCRCMAGFALGVDCWTAFVISSQFWRVFSVFEESWVRFGFGEICALISYLWKVVNLIHSQH